MIEEANSEEGGGSLLTFSLFWAQRGGGGGGEWCACIEEEQEEKTLFSLLDARTGHAQQPKGKKKGGRGSFLPSLFGSLSWCQEVGGCGRKWGRFNTFASPLLSQAIVCCTKCAQCGFFKQKNINITAKKSQSFSLLRVKLVC